MPLAQPVSNHMQNCPLRREARLGWKGFQYAVRASAQVEEPHTGYPGRRADPGKHSFSKKEANRLGVDMLLVGHVTPEEVAKWMRAAHVFLDAINPGALWYCSA